MSVAIYVVGGFGCLLLVLHRLLSPKKLNLSGGHVLITGGSMGIGRALAVEAVKSGANVTILARNKAVLDEAKKEIEESVQDKTKQKVLAISADLTKDHDALCCQIKQAEEDMGPILMLVNCAGFSIAGKFEDIPMSDFRSLMEVNYFGTVSATKAVIEGMKKRGEGRIVMVSSQAGQLGIFGFSAYSPSKYALRGLAEALQMEVKPYNISVTVSFPPDTDTPGYKEEMKSKPRETHLISETSGLFKSSSVAKRILSDSQYGRFQSSIGLDGYMLSNLTCGMTPVGSVLDAISQVFTMSIFRAVSFFYIWSFDRIVAACKRENEASTAKNKKQ